MLAINPVRKAEETAKKMFVTEEKTDATDARMSETNARMFAMQSWQLVTKLPKESSTRSSSSMPFKAVLARART